LQYWDLPFGVWYEPHCNNRKEKWRIWNCHRYATNRHDVTEILLKVALNTMKQTKKANYFVFSAPFICFKILWLLYCIPLLSSCRYYGRKPFEHELCTRFRKTTNHTHVSNKYKVLIAQFVICVRNSYWQISLSTNIERKTTHIRKKPFKLYIKCFSW
jgi:hypothetical protein